ncbi:MAG: hypothetical protein ACD_62C00017G0006 [uncultured bacterium]|nr:MAG: hypothetical protein ACD_62C00017G0006 [uncultured bacterium]
MKAFLPELTNLPDRKVLTITSISDPSHVPEEIFKALFGTAYSTKFKTFKPKGMQMPLGKLCALWPDAHLKPRQEWTGIWAIPVPDFVTKADVIQKDPANPVKLATWKGGQHAQILHKGQYSEEGPTVAKLHAFIEQQGIKMKDVPGTHEEEYLTSPEAKEMKTVIRYRLK